VTRVALIGVGLINASLGMRLRTAGFASHVVGCGRDPGNLAVARERGAIDTATHDVAAAARDADIVVVGTPVRTMAAIFERIATVLAPHAVVTDVGSVKRAVVDAAAAAGLPADRFVPGHPIAGTANSGAAAGFPTLFEGRRWILVPGAGESAQSRIEAMVATVGAECVLMDVDRHDRVFGWVSHLPHLLSFGLAGALGARDGGAMRFGGGGLREFLRIAGSDPVMWRDIFLDNADMLREAWSATAAEAERLLALAEAGDAAALESALDDIRGAVRRLGPPVHSAQEVSS
jgi:prephenate dehydrogenase